MVSERYKPKLKLCTKVGPCPNQFIAVHQAGDQHDSRVKVLCVNDDPCEWQVKKS